MNIHRSWLPVMARSHTLPRRDGGFTRRKSASTSPDAGSVSPAREAESHTRAICSRSRRRTSGGTVFGPSPRRVSYRRLPSDSSIMRLVRWSARAPSGRAKMVRSTEKSSGTTPSGSTRRGLLTHAVSSNSTSNMGLLGIAASVRCARPR